MLIKYFDNPNLTVDETHKLKLKIPVAAIPGSLLCPVMYLNMIDLTPAPTYSPAFVFMKHKKLVPVTYPLLVLV
jgi:hypothetical protein